MYGKAVLVVDDDDAWLTAIFSRTTRVNQYQDVSALEFIMLPPP